MIKLVAFDLDGTVLNGLGVASAESLRVIREMQSAGISLSTMSGRNVTKSLAPFSGEPGLTDAMHCGAYNGALVVGPIEEGCRRILFEQRVPEETLSDLLTHIRERGYNFIYYACDPHPALGVEERYISDRSSASTDSIVRQVGVEFAFDPGLLDRLRRGDLCPPPKVMILPGENRRDDVFREISDLFKGRLYAARTDMDRVELMHPHVNKRAALEHVASAHGIDIAETLAIGDGDNDLPMILGAGIGLIMQNAPDHVRACANDKRIHLVPAFEEEGFAKAMREYVLT
ncbi:MAG: HAD-IIB family hydrolase [Candidatus Latescibacteria bacterium]|nr:HAD-IIB family hydrolase [Candidatus Latescibacterota bacterium]